MRRRALGAAACLGLAWGLLEAQRVECRELDVPVPGLPRRLDGLRILHLSDCHLGSVSLNAAALRKAVAWAASHELDLVALTGDLLSRSRGEDDLRQALRQLRAAHGVFAVLGNHDVAMTRDPFSAAHELDDLRAEGAVLLRDASAVLEVGGARVQVAGADPAAFLAGRSRVEQMADPGADLRILLSHYPEAVDRLDGSFQLVLAGHVHGGQVCIPYPGGKLSFGELRPRYLEGVFELPGSTLVVSRGTGTAFVPFRFFARPEAAVLVLRPR